MSPPFADAMAALTSAKEALLASILPASTWPTKINNVVVAIESSTGISARLSAAHQKSAIRADQPALASMSQSVIRNSADTAATAFAILGMAEQVVAWFRPDGELGVDQLCSLYGRYALSVAATP